QGLAMMTRNHNETSTIKISLRDHLVAATENVDKQIQAQQATQDKSLKSKWKGTIVHEAQKTATMAGRNLAALQEQRAEIVKTASKEWTNIDDTRAGKISQFSNWISAYGGYMEIIVLLCLICNAFFERKTVLSNLDKQDNNFVPNNPEPEQKRIIENNQEPTRTLAYRANKTEADSSISDLLKGIKLPEINNGASTPSKNDQGLKYKPQNNAYTNTSPYPLNTAIHCDPPVSHVTQVDKNKSNMNNKNTHTYSDEILKNACTEIRRDIANLRTKNGEVRTIAGRLSIIFNRVAQFANQKDFDPSGVISIKYYKSMEEACNLMQEKRVPYEFAQEHKINMSKYLPDDKPAGYTYEDVVA
ncbi:MAG: hypothetical protein ACRC78_05590, partial [Planktothrix sp.]